MILVVDYGMGNLRSVEKAFNRLGMDVLISSKPEDIEQMSKILLPGVGHFKKGMENLKDRALLEPLQKAKEEGKPILGICLGMQLLTSSSEEGNVNGLGFIELNTKAFNVPNSIKVPHMGWNTLTVKEEIPLLDGISSDDSFYFAHSYRVESDKSENIAAITNYGEEFASVIHDRNVLGVQFHPEKSHDSGLKLLKNFIDRY